jgi:hypothetical protein
MPIPVAETRLPACWLPDLIHSQMATGNFGKMARDAIAEAKRLNRHDDAKLYAHMLVQVQDYWADMGDNGGTVTYHLGGPDK